jgi:hypothetical protein
MPKINKDYLRFDAFSIKKLIEQKLSENSNYTDQIYAGSDLSIFIDIVANAYQVLQYYINQAGSESIATDSQYYENINRIVKFLDYHPNGYTTSIVDAVVSGVPLDLNNNIIPAYTSVSIADSDEKGNPITYSTTDYFYVYDDTTISNSTASNQIPLYNGKWTIYESPLVAEGIPYETFLLNNLYSDADGKNYTAFPYVHAFVKRGADWMIFKPSTTSLFINTETQKVYNSNEKVFELRLNEYKQVELKFGDGIYAQKLQQGDIIYIAYLKSNGPEGVIRSGAIDSQPMITNITGFDNNSLQEILQLEYSNLVNDSYDFSITPSIRANNAINSSEPVEEESVDQIKEFAPKAFKAGGRLVTADDYDYFIRSNYYKDVVDLKIQNNWSYMKEFLLWLYNKGRDLQNDGGYYLGNSLKFNYGYVYADSCDFNNIYVWMQMKSGFAIPKTEILRRIQTVKTLTGEVVFLDPVLVNFVPCAFDNSYDVEEWDPDNDNYIEIELSTSTVESPERIRSKVNNLIVSYFATKNQKMGALVDLDKLHGDILAIDGVSRIRTIFNDGTNIISVNGLKFMRWSSTILEGADKELTSGTTKLENFMFPRLLEATLKDRIKVITESAYQSNEVEY